MSNYFINLQKTRSGYKVVLYSEDNGKLVLSGESMKNKKDAWDTLLAIQDGWMDKRNKLQIPPAEVPMSYKWPKNSGPKKKAAKKK